MFLISHTLTMRTISIVFTFLYAVTLSAQQSVLHGTVYVFNSQFETNKRQFIVNAQVEEDFGKSQATFTGMDGRFHLPLIGIGEMEKVFYTVKKTGYEVVNTEALQAIAGQTDTQRVFMAPEGKIAENKLKYYRIGREASEKAWAKKLQILETEILAAQADETQRKQLQEEYRRVQAQLDQIEAVARELADRYARTNLDEASADYQKAFRCFVRGALDSTIILLDTALLRADYQKLLDESTRNKAIGAEYQIRSARLLQSKKEAIAALHMKGNLHYLNFDLTRTTECYELLLRLDSTDIEVLSDYGFILSKIERLDQAIGVYLRLKALNLTKEHYVKVHLALAQLYLKKKDFSGSEAYCQQVAAYNKAHFGKKTQAYRNNEAENALVKGDLYFAQNDLKRAWKMYLASDEGYHDLYEKYKDGAYVYKYTQASQKAGLVLQAQKKLARAEVAYLMALMTYAGWSAEVREKIRPDIAFSLYNRGVIYNKAGKYRAAAAILLDALQVYDQLKSRSPQMYALPYAYTAQEMAVALGAVSDFDQALPLIEEAIHIFQGYNRIDPTAFGAAYAQCLYQQGNIYLQEQQAERAKAAFTEAFGVMARKPQAMEQKLRLDIDHGFAQIALLDRDLPRADSLLAKVMSGKKALATEDPATHISEIACVLNSQSELKQLSGDFEQAELLLTQAINLWKELPSNRLYLDRQGLIRTLHAAKTLYLHWMQQGNPAAGAKLKQLYRAFPRFQKRIAEGQKNALMTNALQASGSLQIPHDHKTQAEYWMALNTAHAYLLQGNPNKALKMYWTLKSLRSGDDRNAKTYGEICLEDLEVFERAGMGSASITNMRKRIQSK